MPTLLFSLRGVPNDESDEIRDLLDTHKINYYETSAGNWGISMPALWLTNTNELQEAQSLLNAYHQQRAISQRQNYIQLKKDQKNSPSFTKKSFQFLIHMMAIAFILYLSIKMLFEFGL